ncbi:UNVERIFIED_CONTAM: hypothetical protein K2H54_040704 [Gekko kuhli]
MWLVGLGLALLCTVSAESECSRDHSKAQGKWYVTGMASDCDHFLKHKETIKILVAHVSMKANNKLVITTNFPKEDGCKKMEMVFDKLDDGTYVHTADWGSAKKMDIVSTDCKTYAIARAQVEHKGKTSNNLAVYSRKPEMSSEIKKKFLEAASSEFTSDQIIFPHEVACETEE